MNSTTMTIRLPIEVHDGLSRLSQGTRRSRSFLAAEALAAYVSKELSIIEGIEHGQADVSQGKVTAHETVMAELHAIIDAAESQKVSQA